MGRGVRVVLFNAEESAQASLRSILLAIEGVKIVAEIDDAVLLPQAVDRVPTDVVLLHLDPDPDAVLAMAGEVIRNHPQVAVVAASDSTDGQLILSAMRVGLKEFLPEPLNPAELGAALDKLVQVRADRPALGKLVTVIGAAGGVGATAVATNLAVELAGVVGDTGGGVALVDMDYRFGHVGTLLDLDPTYSIADLCESHEHLESQLVERALAEHASGVKALCRPPHFAQAENITAAHCVGVLSTLVRMHAYVIVDGPNRFDAGARAVFDLSDLNLLIIHLLVPCVRSARRMLDGLREAGFNMERTRVICNRVGKESGSLSVEDVEGTLGVPVFASLPDDWAAMCNAINMGDPLATSAPKSRVRGAIAELAVRLHKLDAACGASDDKGDGKKGKKKTGKLLGVG